MTFRKDWIEGFLCPRWCRAVESSLGIRKQESCLDEQERNKNMDIFGKKRISELEKELSKNKEKLSRYEYTNDDLNDEIKRLTDELNAKVIDCNVGPWCYKCKYSSSTYTMNRNNIEYLMKNSWARYTCNDHTKIQYCSKHLRELCPEFNNMKEE